MVKLAGGATCPMAADAASRKQAIARHVFGFVIRTAGLSGAMIWLFLVEPLRGPEDTTRPIEDACWMLMQCRLILSKGRYTLGPLEVANLTSLRA